MARVAGFALFGLADGLYARYSGAHCYQGHGGTPLDANDTAISNVTTDECEAICDNTTECVAITQARHSKDYRNPRGDCYLRSDVNVSECEITERDHTWTTYTHVEPPPLTVTSYHLFEGKYTGLANKDAGDFKGDAGFIFGTFGKWSKGNPEASMEHNIIEMSEVNVTGWGKYEECNAPGAEGMFTCPANQTDYCCTNHNIPTNHTRTQLPGLEVSVMTLGPQFGFGGFWFSFPRESQGVTWTEKTLRRIAGKCLGDAWRKDAGGCDQCGEDLDSCVADCIKASLCVGGDVALLQATWDRVFADPNECPDVPFPSDSSIVV